MTFTHSQDSRKPQDSSAMTLSLITSDGLKKLKGLVKSAL